MHQVSAQDKTGIGYVEHVVGPGVIAQIWENTKHPENNFDLKIIFSKQARIDTALAPLLSPLLPPEVFKQKMAA